MSQFLFEEYLDAIQSKDNQAFEVVYYETYKGVFAMIYSIVSDRHLAEDVMQETYIKMVEKLHTYERGRNFRAWLLQIAKNSAYDALRKKKRASESLDDGSVLEKVPHPTKSDSAITDYLSTLSEDERAIVTLRFVHQLSFKDIASVMSQPLPTIYSKYKVAMSKMKETLGKE